MKTLISTDTSCIVKYGVLEKLGIKTFPLNVIIDGVEYLDGVTINQTELKEAMRANKVIKTSTPPLGQVITYFEEIFDEGYDRVIHFTISSKLSSMYELFENVSKNYFDGKIIVIDSLGLSSLMLSQVLLTYEELNKGTDIDKIKELIENTKTNNHITFIPENLNALKNGGRISPAIAVIANTIGLKPVISFTNGELVKDSMTRNVKRYFAEVLNKVAKEYPIDRYDYVMVTFDAKEDIVDFIKERSATALNGDFLIKGIVPINICAHCGPGTIGLLIVPKVNGKSLVEYFK